MCHARPPPSGARFRRHTTVLFEPEEGKQQSSLSPTSKFSMFPVSLFQRCSGARSGAHWTRRGVVCTREICYLSLPLPHCNHWNHLRKLIARLFFRPTQLMNTPAEAPCPCPCFMNMCRKNNTYRSIWDFTIKREEMALSLEVINIQHGYRDEPNRRSSD